MGNSNGLSFSLFEVGFVYWSEYSHFAIHLVRLSFSNQENDAERSLLSYSREISGSHGTHLLNIVFVQFEFAF